MAAHLADLARLYERAEPGTRQRLALALFARAEALGPTKLRLYSNEETVAQGWATTMSGEFTAKIGRNGRGERTRAYTFQVIVIVGEEASDRTKETSAVTLRRQSGQRNATTRPVAGSSPAGEPYHASRSRSYRLAAVVPHCGDKSFHVLHRRVGLDDVRG